MLRPNELAVELAALVANLALAGYWRQLMISQPLFYNRILVITKTNGGHTPYVITGFYCISNG
jgi:hypothetical protein